jgi:hypothetical protein
MPATSDAGYLTWGGASAKLLRTMRLEAARSGHEDAQPSHLLLAVLDQPEVHQAFRAVKQKPDVYQVRARVASSSLGPGEFSDDMPLSRLTETVLEDVRGRETGEPEELLYLLALKASLNNQACRVLIVHAGIDPSALDEVLARVA